MFKYEIERPNFRLFKDGEIWALSSTTATFLNFIFKRYKNDDGSPYIFQAGEEGKFFLNEIDYVRHNKQLASALQIEPEKMDTWR